MNSFKKYMLITDIKMVYDIDVEFWCSFPGPSDRARVRGKAISRQSSGEGEIAGGGRRRSRERTREAVVILRSAKRDEGSARRCSRFASRPTRSFAHPLPSTSLRMTPPDSLVLGGAPCLR